MLTIFPKTESLSVPVKNRQALVLLRQFTLEELYKAWGAKGKEESRRNTVVLQGFPTQNSASQAK